MKKFLFIMGILMVILANPTQKVTAQVNININIGQQPAWGPVGYDYVRYYYFPALNIYFDVPSSLFYYLHKGRWIAARYLPPHYSKYDLYSTYKVVLNTSTPWVYNRKHKRLYSKYKRVHNQIVIRDCHDERYHRSRHNHIRWIEDRHHPQPPRPPRPPKAPRPPKPPKAPYTKELNKREYKRNYKEEHESKNKRTKQSDKKKKDHSDKD